MCKDININNYYIKYNMIRYILYKIIICIYIFIYLILLSPTGFIFDHFCREIETYRRIFVSTKDTTIQIAIAIAKIVSLTRCQALHFNFHPFVLVKKRMEPERFYLNFIFNLNETPKRYSSIPTEQNRP